jgi:hypothetical protein
MLAAIDGAVTLQSWRRRNASIISRQDTAERIMKSLRRHQGRVGWLFEMGRCGGGGDTHR